MVGAVLGPLLAGKVFDDCGSYQTIWLVFSGFAAAAVFLVASTPSVGVVRE